MKAPGLRVIVLSCALLSSVGTMATTNTAITAGAWENGANWSSGAAPVATDLVMVPAGIAMTLNASGNVCAGLTIANSGGWVLIKPGAGLAIGGNLSNAGTLTVQAGSTLTFNGAANSTITGGGIYSIAGTVAMNMGSAATSLDVLDQFFIAGINSGGNYFFTFTKGIFIMDNTGTLNDAYNSGSTNSLLIPFGVTIQVNSGTMNLAQNGTMATIGNGIATYGQSNIILSGKLFINGGTVNVAMNQPASTNAGQTLAMGVDLQYHANGGTPQLYMTSGQLNLGSGFDYYSNTDYVDFNMTGGTIIAASKGSSYMGTFQLNDKGGGKTLMSGGLIELTDASWGVYPDIDLGGPNVQGLLYSVTGGTVQFGSPLTANAGTYFAFEAWPQTNYPNMSFQSGLAKVAQPLNNADFRMYSLTANANMTFSVADYLTGNTTKNMYIDGNNGTWAFDDEGGFVAGTSTVNFIASINQPINSSALATATFYNVVVANLAGATTSASGTVTTLKVGGSLTVNSGNLSPGTMTTLNVTSNVTLNAGTLTVPTTTNVGGNWTNNGGTFAPGTGTVNFNGALGQVIGGTATIQTFYNMVAKLTAGQSLSTGGSTATIIANNFTETTGNVNGPASLIVKGNAVLSTGTFTAGTNTSIAGNLTNNSGGFAGNGGTVTFNGAAAQTIGGSQVTTFNNLTIANSSGNVKLNIASNVSNQLAFTLGKLDASSFPLTILNGVAVTGATANMYVIVGNGVAKTGLMTIDNLPANTATAFPIGTATNYLPATLNPGAIVGQAYSAYVFNPATFNAVSGGPAFSAGQASNILSVIWNIAQTAGAGSATLGVNWAAVGTALDGANFKVAGTNIGIGQYTGGFWQWPTGTGNVATTSATSTFNTFSQFLVQVMNIILPMEITDFNAVLNRNKTVNLTWDASGIGFTRFDVERSSNGTDWTTIGSVAAEATDASGHYSFIDENPLAGVNQYRLIGQQSSGNPSYSPIREVSLQSMAAIGIYPNPTTDHINVSLNNATPDLYIRLVSLTGQVLETIKPAATGASVTTISVQRYPAALYFVQLVNSQRVLQVSSVLVSH